MIIGFGLLSVVIVIIGAFLACLIETIIETSKNKLKAKYYTWIAVVCLTMSILGINALIGIILFASLFFAYIILNIK